MQKFLAEVRRRNVHRVALGYLAVGWLITEVLGTALPTINAPDWIAKLVLVLFLIGLPLALWFSWEFEVTPEGVKRTHEVSNNESITDHTGKKLDRIIIGILGAAVLVLLGDKFIGSKVRGAVDSPGTEIAAVASADAISSIAVLPFADFSESADQKFIAHGIADTVLHLLAQVPDLKVAARTSSFAYEGRNIDIATVASELGVGAVLEGSVQRAGDRLRVIAQLIRASDQSHLWSETFDNSTNDVFAIQDDIAQSVLAVLRPDSVNKETPVSERTDLAAYEHYLRGKDLRIAGTAESVESALEELQAATLIDPGFVPALIELGYTYMNLNGVTQRTWADIEPLAEASFRRAVKLSPDDPAALVGLGSFIRNAGYDPLSALPYFERALALNPNDAGALTLYASLSIIQGKIDVATDAYLRAYTLDPNNPQRASEYGRHLARLGRLDEARGIARRLLVAQPDQPRGHELLTNIAELDGRLDLAVSYALDYVETNPGSYAGYYELANYYAMLGDQDTGMEWYRRNKTDDYIPRSLFWTEAEAHQLLTQAERDLKLYKDWNNGQRRYIEALFANRKIAEGVKATALYEDAFETDVIADDTAAAGVLAARLGEVDLAGRLLMRARTRNQLMFDAKYLSFNAHFVRAMLAIADDDHNEAFAQLNAFIDTGGIDIRYFEVHPVWDPLREDSRFDALLKRLSGKLKTQRDSLAAKGL